MTTPTSKRRRQYCARCGQVMFQFYQSPDGHFGLVDDMAKFQDRDRSEVRCPTCGARYRFLETVDPTGLPIRKL